VQPEADENPEGDGAGRNTQAEASTMKTAAVVGTADGDAQAEASAAEMTVGDAVVIHHEAKIPQQLEV
jgi:hypothetical protein